MFCTGLLEMKEALDAYCRVLRFSSIFESHGLRHANISVKELPPRDYRKRQVSFESLYGM